MSEEIKQAMAVLSKAIKNDPEYAWAWHCNIAMAYYDEGVGGKQASNRAAARFMGLCFGVDTSKNEHFPDTQGPFDA